MVLTKKCPLQGFKNFFNRLGSICDIEFVDLKCQTPKFGRRLTASNDTESEFGFYTTNGTVEHHFFGAPGQEPEVVTITPEILLMRESENERQEATDRIATILKKENYDEEYYIALQEFRELWQGTDVRTAGH